MCVEFGEHSAHEIRLTQKEDLKKVNFGKKSTVFPYIEYKILKPMEKSVHPIYLGPSLKDKTNSPHLFNTGGGGGGEKNGGGDV